MLRAARGPEAKYLVRTLVQNLRVGASWRSVVGPLARSAAGYRRAAERAAAASATAAAEAAAVVVASAMAEAAAADAAAAAAAAAAGEAAAPSETAADAGHSATAAAAAAGSCISGVDARRPPRPALLPLPPLLTKAELDRAAAAAAAAFHVCPSFEALVPALLEWGEDAGARMGMVPGVPVKPMLAKISKICVGVGDALLLIKRERDIVTENSAQQT
ncbi:hypothetical protein FOA52_010070 [Chlamydomonas sp. UWO 241]|nr:hypothetical protein FOA52_010070 [Chlamydomonas sp. UWO 241]